MADYTFEDTKLHPRIREAIARARLKESEAKHQKTEGEQKSTATPSPAPTKQAEDIVSSEEKTIQEESQKTYEEKVEGDNSLKEIKIETEEDIKVSKATSGPIKKKDFIIENKIESTISEEAISGYDYKEYLYYTAISLVAIGAVGLTYFAYQHAKYYLATRALNEVPFYGDIDQHEGTPKSEPQSPTAAGGGGGGEIYRNPSRQAELESLQGTGYVGRHVVETFKKGTAGVTDASAAQATEVIRGEYQGLLNNFANYIGKGTSNLAETVNENYHIITNNMAPDSASKVVLILGVGGVILAGLGYATYSYFSAADSEPNMNEYPNKEEENLLIGENIPEAGNS